MYRHDETTSLETTLNVGMMTEDIQKCLRIVLEGLGNSAIPAAEIVAFCDQLARRDCIKCICHEEINAVRSRFERKASQDK